MFSPQWLRRLAIAAVPLFAVLIAGERQGHAEQSADWTVSEISGSVLVNNGDGADTPAAKGDRLPIGSAIKTPADGRAVLTRGETSMTVSPNSEITLASEGNGTSRTTIFQKIGAVLYKVTKQSEQHFEVETPYLAAVVKGTSFSVGVNRDTAVTHVVEGAVEVTSLATRQIQIVRPGQTATVSSGNGMQLEMSHNSGGSPDTEAADQANAATETAGKEQSTNRVVGRTLGETKVNIAEVTDGLVSSGNGRGNGVTSANPNKAEGNGVGTDSGLSVGVIDVDNTFPGQGNAVATGFPGQGTGVAGGFPGQGNGVATSAAGIPSNNPNKGSCNNSGNGNGNGNGNNC